jgi:heterodisulfide reductase subunit A-like polyferredoxin
LNPRSENICKKNSVRGMTKRAIVDDKICTGCQACMGLCPTEAITIKNEAAFVVPLFCKGCGYCIEGCGEEAIRMIEYSPI